MILEGDENDYMSMHSYHSSKDGGANVSSDRESDLYHDLQEPKINEYWNMECEYLPFCRPFGTAVAVCAL